jgi:protein ImuB
MAFASIYVPNFTVQAAVRAEPALKGCPIAILDGTPPLETVVAANRAACKKGLRQGMSKSQAEQFCAVQICWRRETHEESAHAALLDLGWSVSPRIEDAAQDAIVVDLDGLGSLFGSEAEIAATFVRRAFSLGLAIQVAVAANLETAIHAARGFSGITVIPQGEESQRLGSLPVSVLSPPMEILETLERWGVHNCAALSALPLLDLSERLGQSGVRLHQQARGANVRSLLLAEPALDFEEKLTLESAVAELEPLAFILGRLLDQLCGRLEARSLAAGVIRVRFQLEAFSEDNSGDQDGIPYRKRTPSKTNIFEKSLTLPVPMRDSKTLLRLLRLHLQSDPPCAAVLAIVLSADPACPRSTQGGLFLPSSPDPQRLELTLARLANLVGDANIGSPRLLDTHRPDAFQMRRFVPSSDAMITEPLQGSVISAAPITGFRTFRPSPPAIVELCEGRPVRISFRGLRGDVVAASGPWRSSGEWWRKDAWQQDEWDLEIRFAGFSGESRTLPDSLYRLYFDAVQHRWFVRGVYD